MAGYRIFYKPTYQEIVDTLAEIGITLSNPSNGNYTVTFSDNKSASFTVPSTNAETYIVDQWIFADDESHTFMMLADDGDPSNSDVTPHSTNSSFRIKVFISEKEDGTLYSNKGFDGASSLTTSYLYVMVNLPTLDTSRISNNDPALTELKLVPLAGNFYFASSGSASPDDEYLHPIFKHVYVNFHRWFPFGTVIRGANGETFMGWGWILFRLGANS